MTVKVLVSVLFICSSLLFGRESAKPFATVDLDGARPNSTKCSPRGTNWIRQVFWLDDAHLVGVRVCKDRKPSANHEAELFVIDKDQHVLSIRTDGGFEVVRGPSGTVLIGRKNKVEVLDSSLQTVQTIDCPGPQTRCYVFTPPSPGQSDFAICSTEKRLEMCTFYAGRPATAIRTTQLDSYGTTPYGQLKLPEWVYGARGAVAVTQNEIWFVDFEGSLMSVLPNGTVKPVLKRHLAPYNSTCDGEVSKAEYRQYLAICSGVWVYTDGAWDNIFGYSRIAMVDVGSRRVKFRVDGHMDTRAALSPSGQLVAVAYGDKVQMYHIP